MPSQFGWMDHDDDQRRRMLAAIELFKDDGTIDELGIGAVRDTIATALFPGVSVLHTRARYLLFVPWCVTQTAESGLTGNDAIVELRRLEIRLLHALINGGDENGLIGRVARHNLKRLPSAAYWSVLHRWGIRRTDSSITGYLRDARTLSQQLSRRGSTDDPAGSADRPIVGFDPSLPEPPPDLHKQADFVLSPAESDYLAFQWRTTATGSLLPWLLDAGAPQDTPDVSQHPALATAPADMQDLVQHGRRFARLIHGAALLYNLLLAETFDKEDDRHLVEHYRDRLLTWSEEISSAGYVDAWDRDVFWITVRRRSPGLKRQTETFVENWIELLRRPGPVADDKEARALVANRERSIKGGRARLFNAAARQQWSGTSGLVELDYNWRVARRLATDVLAPAGVN